MSKEIKRRRVLTPPGDKVREIDAVSFAVEQLAKRIELLEKRASAQEKNLQEIQIRQEERALSIRGIRQELAGLREKMEELAQRI